MKAILTAAALAIVLPAAASAADIGTVSAIHVSIGSNLQAKADLYGQGELARLANTLEEDVQRAVEDAGLAGPHGAELALTLVDATPNRPTFTELASRPGLSPLSIAIGGASIEGAITYADGRSTPLAFHCYAADIRDEIAATTWSDAQWTFERFAHDLARGRLTNNG